MCINPGKSRVYYNRRQSSEPSYHPIFGQIFDLRFSIISIVDVPYNIL